MSRLRFDQYTKQFLDEFLSPFGTVERSYEIPGEPRQVDLYFIPTFQPAADLTSLGLLGRIAASPCLLEPYRNQPSLAEMRSCLLKLLWLQTDLQRRQPKLSDDQLPQLWIFTASASATLLSEFGASPSDDWLPGIYWLPSAHKAAIVSIRQLPVTEETLWLRILGKGRTQRRAINEMLALSEDDLRRTTALRILTNWKISLELSQTLDNEEGNLVMTLSQAFLEWEQQTEQRGEQQGQRLVVENLLKVRFGKLDEPLSAIIPALLQLPVEQYTAILLQLSQLSRQELIERVQAAASE